jgi:hypothetical protein
MVNVEMKALLNSSFDIPCSLFNINNRITKPKEEAIPGRMASLLYNYCFFILSTYQLMNLSTDFQLINLSTDLPPNQKPFLSSSGNFDLI